MSPVTSHHMSPHTTCQLTSHNMSSLTTYHPIQHVTSHNMSPATICHTGSSSWLDFTSPAVRKFWADTLQPETYKGSTLDLFTWNDMNEPSVFNGYNINSSLLSRPLLYLFMPPMFPFPIPLLLYCISLSPTYIPFPSSYLLLHQHRSRDHYAQGCPSL